jgi:hypothetical protein
MILAKTSSSGLLAEKPKLQKKKKKKKKKKKPRVCFL